MGRWPFLIKLGMTYPTLLIRHFCSNKNVFEATALWNALLSFRFAQKRSVDHLFGIRTISVGDRVEKISTPAGKENAS